MTKPTTPTSDTDNTASNEAMTPEQLREAITMLTLAVENLNGAATISLAIDPAAAKILKRLAQQAGEIKQIYTASLAIHNLQFIKFGPNDDTATPRP